MTTKMSGPDFIHLEKHYAKSSEAKPSFPTASLRTASDTRKLAVALLRAPIPELTKRDVETRWSVGPDTVRRVLRTQGVDPGGEKSLLIPLTDVLLCEGDREPLATWVSSSDDERKILTVDLLTMDEVLAAQQKSRKITSDAFYRRLKAGKVGSIRIGSQHRFRRDLAAAEAWLAERESVK